MPADKSETPTVPSAPVNKAGKLAAHEAALSRAETATANLQDIERQFFAAKQEQAEALEEAERLYGEAYAEDILASVQQAETNEKRHKAHCEDHCKDIAARKKAREERGEAACDHKAVKVITFDGHTHPVTSAHELKLGTRGFASGKPRAGSRYHVACGPSIDAAHDELDHERFDQSKKPDCAKCDAALAMMDSGEIADTRGDYLSSKEQIAHVRMKTADHNKATSERAKRSPVA